MKTRELVCEDEGALRLYYIGGEGELSLVKTVLTRIASVARTFQFAGKFFISLFLFFLFFFCIFFFFLFSVSRLFFRMMLIYRCWSARWRNRLFWFSKLCIEIEPHRRVVSLVN